MTTLNNKTTKTRREYSRVRSKIDVAVLMSPETEAQVRRISDIRKIATRTGRIAVAAVEACNHRDSENPDIGIFIPTPKMEAACDRADAASHELNQIYLDTKATSDLPDDALIHVLRVRLLYTPGGEREWCAKILALGGPRISARWLFKYLMGHLQRRPGRIDRRVRAALILEDEKGAVPTKQQPG